MVERNEDPHRTSYELIERWKPKMISPRTQEELQQRSNLQDLQIQSLLQRLDETKIHSKLLDSLNQAETEAASVGQGSFGACGTSPE